MDRIAKSAKVGPSIKHLLIVKHLWYAIQLELTGNT